MISLKTAQKDADSWSFLLKIAGALLWKLMKTAWIQFSMLLNIYGRNDGLCNQALDESLLFGLEDTLFPCT